MITHHATLDVGSKNILSIIIGTSPVAHLHQNTLVLGQFGAFIDVVDFVGLKL
jgi:hypothetical protein